MRYHWHRMHNKIFELLRKVKIICKTSMVCNKIKNACGVNDTACTVHTVSLTPHAKYDTACTIDKQFERPWKPLEGISIKNIYVPELSYPTTKKIEKFKRLRKKKFSCMRCHWHRMHDFFVRKLIISRRIRSRIQKGFCPWLREPRGYCFYEKTEGRISLISLISHGSNDTVLLKWNFWVQTRLCKAKMFWNFRFLNRYGIFWKKTRGPVQNKEIIVWKIK
jgi:hypothetical protein